MEKRVKMLKDFLNNKKAELIIRVSKNLMLISLILFSIIAVLFIKSPLGLAQNSNNSQPDSITILPDKKPIDIPKPIINETLIENTTIEDVINETEIDETEDNVIINDILPEINEEPLPEPIEPKPNATKENVSINPEIVDADGKPIQASIEIINPTSKISTPIDSDKETIIEKGTYDIRIRPTDSPISEIYIENASISSNLTGLIKIDNPLDKQGYLELYAIDPTSLNFTEATVTATAKGNILYKCKDWDFESQTCPAVQKNCTGSTKDNTICTIYGGWQKVAMLTLGETYKITLTSSDPAYAEYNATLGAPRCKTSDSPCIANSSLLQCNDNQASPGPEPNQPNTIDACTDSTTSGTCYVDESIENITITSLNSSYIRPGDTVNVTFWAYCYGTMDRVALYYTNSTSSISWQNKLAGTTTCAAAGYQSRTVTFVLSNVTGEHAVRAIMLYNANINSACPTGDYRDQDDVAFLVEDWTDYPITTLVSPSNGRVMTAKNVNFTCNATDNLQLSNITFYWNYSGSWQANGTVTVLGTSNQTIFERTNLDNQAILWNCRACDNDSQCSFAPVNYTVTPNAPEYAIYSSIFTTPYCEEGKSACIANSSLLMSVDSVAGTAEPNQPNTIDDCADGTGGTYLTDESVENITIRNHNYTYFRTGDTIGIEAWVHCYAGADYTNDNFGLVYTNNSNSTSVWVLKQYMASGCPGQGFQKIVFNNITLDNVAGNHSIRVWINYDESQNSSQTCGARSSGTNYADNDDVVFLVSSINQAPQISLNLPGNNSQFNNSQNINFNFTAYDNQNITLNCSIYLDGVRNQTNSTTRNGTLTNFLINGISYANHNWFVNCSDGQFSNVSATWIFRVNDTISPTINFTSPTEASGTTLTTRRNIIINVTALDTGTGLKNITIRLYNSTRALINSTNSTSSPLYYNFSVSANGIYYFNATARDSANNANSTETRNVTIFYDMTFPLISIVYPQNMTYNTNVSALNYTLVEINPNTCWYSLNSGQNNISITCGNNVTGLTSTEGSNTWIVWANDTAGQTNYSSITFSKDSIIPAIQFVSPSTSSGNHSQNWIFANVTASDTHLGTIVIRLYNTTGLMNSTSSSTSPLSINFTNLADGTYYLNATANDTYGNLNSTATRTIVLDIRNPSINFVSPTETSGSKISRKNILINVTASDTGTGLKNITIMLYNTTSLVNSTSSSTSPYFVNITIINDGTYWFNASVYDYVNRVNYTETRNITIDTQFPLWFNPSKNITTVYSNDIVKFNATWTDNIQLAGYIFAIKQNGTYWNSSYIPFSGTSNVSENTSVITAPAGTNITWYFWANDTIGNSNQTALQSFVVQSNPTTVLFSVNQSIYEQGRSPGHGLDINIPFEARYLDNLGNPIPDANCYVINDETNDNVTLTYNATTGNYTGELNDYMMYDVVTFNVSCSKTNYNSAINSTSTNVWLYYFLWEWENTSYSIYNIYTTHWMRKEPTEGTNVYALTQNITTNIGDNEQLEIFYFCGAGTNCSVIKNFNMEGIQTLRLNLSITNTSCMPYLCIGIANWYNNKILETCGLPQAIPANTPTLLEQNITINYSVSQGEYLYLRTRLSCSASVPENVTFYYNYSSMPANVEIHHAQPFEIISFIATDVQLEPNYTIGPNSTANVTRKWWITFNNTKSIAQYIQYWFKPQILIEYTNLNINNTIYIYNSTGQLLASDNASAGAPEVATSHADNQVDWYTELVPGNTAINETLQRGVLNAIQNNETLVYNSSEEKTWDINVWTVFVPEVIIYNVTLWTNYSAYGVPDNFEFKINITNSSGTFDITSQAIVNATTKTITMPLTHLSQVVYTVTASDTTPPTIHLIAPANGTTTNIASQVFSCNITNVEIANLGLYIWNSSSSLIHSNTTNLSGAFNSTNWTYSLPYDDSFKWNCLGYDSNGNSNYSSEGNYTITLDTIKPIITIYSPQNTTYNNKTVLVNFTADSYQTLWFFNGTANETYTTPVYRIFAEGSNTLIAYANDSAGNSNSTSITFAIDTIKPTIQFASPTETSGTTLNDRDNIIVNVTASDNALANITIYLFNSTSGLLNATSSSASPYLINFTDLANGQYFFNATARDSANNANSTETRNVTIFYDVTFPQISIIYPENTTYNVNVSELNYTFVEVNPNTCWYSLNGGLTTVTITCGNNITGLTSNEGSNTWTVWINDTAGQTNFSSVTFSKDTIKPLVQFISPTTASGNYSQNWIFANVTASDTQLGTIVIRLHNSTSLVNSTSSPTSPLSINFTNLADGTYYLNATANDTYGNLNSTETRTIILDTTKPKITFIEPTPDNNAISSPSLTINVSVINSLAVDTCTLNWNGTNESMTKVGSGNNVTCYKSKSELTEANYTYRVYANDSIGNLNVSETRNITINTPPSVIIITPFGNIYDEYSHVPIIANISDINGLNLTIAQVTLPNSTKENLTLARGQESEDFNADTMDINWGWENSTVGPGQTCTTDINTTISGAAYISLIGDGAPNTDTYCSILSKKAVAGDFDISISFNATSFTGSDMAINLVLLEEPTSIVGVNQIFVSLSNWTGSGLQYQSYVIARNFSNFTSIRNINDTYGKLRITRTNDTFMFYTWNSTSWFEENMSLHNFSLNKALYVTLQVESAAPGWGTASVSWDDLIINSSNYTFGMFSNTALTGDYNATILARDSFGILNNTEKTNFTIQFMNSKPSVPFIQYPAPNSIINNIQDISWSNVIDKEGDTLQFNITLLNVDYSINSTIVSNYGNASTTSYSWNTANYKDGYYSLKVKVFENATAERLSNSYTIIGNFSIDNTPPSIDFVEPTPVSGTVQASSDILINVTSFDIKFNDIRIELYNSNYSLMDKFMSLTSPAYYNFSGYEDGLYFFNATTTDTLENINSTETRNITIDTITPVITIYSPQNTTYNNKTVLVNFTADSYQTLWFFNGTANETYTTPVYRIFAEGSNTLIAYANDSAGNQNSTSVVFSTDTLKPTINFTNPTETSGSLINTRNNVLVNVTANDTNLANITIYLFNSTSGLLNATSSSASPYLINFTDLANGQYFFNATTRDSANNANSTETRNVTIFYDVTFPLISIVYPQNTTYNMNVSQLNYTLVEANPQACWYSLNSGQTNTTITCGNNVTGLTSIEGSNTWTVWTNDTVGNVNSSSVTFFKDTVKPLISITYPQNITYNTDISRLNYTVSDANIKSCWYSSNGGQTNTTITCGNNVTGLTSIEGSNTWTVGVDDTAGNANSSSITFNKDTTSPNIISAYINPYDPAVGYNVTLNATATDNLAVSGIFANITLPNGTVTTRSMPMINYTIQVSGRHNVTFWANDTAGNIASSEDYFIAGSSQVTVQFNVIDVNLSGVLVNLTIYFTGTDKEVHEHNFTGIYIDEHTTILYDLLFNTIDGNISVRLNEINLSLDSNSTLGLDRFIPSSDYFVTYGFNSTYNFTDAEITISYTGTGYSDEYYLGVYRCTDWNFENRTCSGTWESVSATQDTALDTFTLTVTGFSAYSIKQETVPVTPPSGGEAPSAGGAGGAASRMNISITGNCSNEYVRIKAIDSSTKLGLSSVKITIKTDSIDELVLYTDLFGQAEFKPAKAEVYTMKFEKGFYITEEIKHNVYECVPEEKVPEIPITVPEVIKYSKKAILILLAVASAVILFMMLVRNVCKRRSHKKKCGLVQEKIKDLLNLERKIEKEFYLEIKETGEVHKIKRHNHHNHV